MLDPPPPPPVCPLSVRNLIISRHGLLDILPNVRKGKDRDFIQNGEI